MMNRRNFNQICGTGLVMTGISGGAVANLIESTNLQLQLAEVPKEYRSSISEWQKVMIENMSDHPNRYHLVEQLTIPVNGSLSIENRQMSYKNVHGQCISVEITRDAESKIRVV